MEENKENLEKKGGKLKQNQIAGAIVIAGFLIAGAILLRGPSGNSSVKSISRELGLNQKAFAKCRAGEETKKAVQAEQDDGLKAGAQGTPYTVLIAKDGKKYVLGGAYPYEEVKKIIDSILAGTATNNVPVDLKPVSADEYISGDINADIVAVEYSDPECPFSKRFHTVMQQVMKNYPGKVAWVFRFFPLDSIHQKARSESEAIECAGTLKGGEMYWKYLDRVFEITPSNDGLDPALL
jgi:protein-disulfide isomerase